MEIRGPLGAVSNFCMSIGTLMTFIIGPLVDYEMLTLFGLVVALIFIVPFYFVPESPYFYIMKGRRKDAATALQRLRGYKTQDKLEKEIIDIEVINFKTLLIMLLYYNII